MKKSRQTKRALIPSLLAVILCVAMLVGTTFAWFTDTASTSVNKIEAGKLDVELYYKDDNGNWTDAKDQTLGWVQATSADGATTKIVTDEGLPLWEPGCTFTLPELKIVNEGNLALKYKIAISGIQGNAKLNEAITWTTTLGTETEALGTEHSLAAKTTDETKTDYYDTFTISGHMKEDAGNEYQGLSIDGIAITVYAKQDTVEYDSTTDQYDANAAYELKINESATGNLPVSSSSTTSGATVETATTISSGSVSVTYPAGVKLDSTASGTVTGETDKKAAVTQKLEYVGSTTTTTGVSVNDNQAVSSYTLTLPVAESNEVLVPVTIDYNKGLTGVVVYHSGTALGTSEPDKNSRGEYFTYDKDSGKLVLYLKSASPIDIVYDATPGTTTVTTRAQLEAALADTSISTIKLGGDINNPEGTTSSIRVLRDVTIDFNGHILGIGLESGSTTHGSDSANLVLTDSSGNETAGLQCKIIHVDGGGMKQFCALGAWQNKITINGGKYSHDAAVINCQLQNQGGNDTIIINGGTFVGEGNASVIANVFGEVIINGGTFTATHKDTGNGECLYVSYGSGHAGSITNINGGTFFSDSSRLIYVKVDTNYTQKVSISGGDFTVGDNAQLVVFSEDVTNVKDFLTITGGTFNVDPSAYVATGYQAVKNETAGTWTVTAQ